MPDEARLVITISGGLYRNLSMHAAMIGCTLEEAVEQAITASIFGDGSRVLEHPRLEGEQPLFEEVNE